MRIKKLEAVIGLVAAGLAAETGAHVLGPEDQITIRALHAEEIADRPVFVGTNGYINLPLVGRLKAAGLTVEQLESELTQRLAKYLEDPRVAVAVAEYRSQPVSVMGSVTNPGVYQLRGGKSLVEVLSMAGGLKADAGNKVKVSRRLGDGTESVVEVDWKAVMEARSAADKMIVQPHDVITVPQAEMVYVMGEVGRPGGYVLNERESFSSLQALSLAGGLNRTAAAQNAKILRGRPGAASRVEIPLNLKEILAGKGQDVRLEAEDILFVPSSAARNAGLRVVEAAIQMGTGVVIWRR